MDKERLNGLLLRNFFSGIAWSFGATVGFAIISTILVLFVRSLGGLPFVGSFIASVVEETQLQLIKRTFIIPN